MPYRPRPQVVIFDAYKVNLSKKNARKCDVISAVLRAEAEKGCRACQDTAALSLKNLYTIFLYCNISKVWPVFIR